MTQLEWKKLEETVTQMSADEKRRLLAIVNSSLTKANGPASDPLLGLMADKPDLVDQVVKLAFEARESQPLIPSPASR
jgi:hypothetical protein